jgi:hypothetical protein
MVRDEPSFFGDFSDVFLGEVNFPEHVSLKGKKRRRRKAGR